MKKHRVFAVWFLIFLAWAFYRAYFQFPEWVDELIVKPIIFVFPLIYIVLIKEKNKLSSLGFSSGNKDIMFDFFIGVFVGVLFAMEGLLANYLKYGKFVFTPIIALNISGGLYPFLLISFATSFWEEILGRGYLYQRLLSLSKNQFWAASLSSFLFLLLHIPIMFTRLSLRGLSFGLYPFSILLLGITNCYLLSARKSLTLPILLHTFWNMTLSLYL